MKALETRWEQELRQSRLVILPADQSYVNGVGVSAWTIVQQLAVGANEQQLRRSYPALTRTDIRACQLFAYLRTVQLV